MTLLVISPDYASHLLPLATIATAQRRPGERVVVATGPATTAVVADFGFERIHLVLGRGSNPGVIRAEQQPTGEDDALRGFFAATHHGMVATLTYQAEARRNDLLWAPVPTARAVLQVVEQVKPDRIIVDHLAFSATLALRTAGIPFQDVVLGHPTALPVGTEIYGYPSTWPDQFHPEPVELDSLQRLCRSVRDEFTDEVNAVVAVLDPGAAASDDAFADHGHTVLFNYPAALHPARRTALLPPHHFLGSSIRTEKVAQDVRRWLDEDDDRPVVYVSFGSFLSARADVLARVVEALRKLPVRVALATGSADSAVLGELPAAWLVRSFLPQVAILERSALAISHGGNNSITEALHFEVPLLVLPFSTDQFAGAAAIETAHRGVVLDPNTATPGDLLRVVGTALRR
ncbi:glycosyltransferase [Kineosporia mesophila]|uniref:Glycosyltransferase n=1 Tax=Kineosporia mesophila TaxID=566012 RepID=A0ABP7A688_9ACTN|nr:glycosyltransferase [Kineosporia mesophila]MCD5351545.1 glycosyltransferase [Kineosporia mesophila]